MTRKPEGDEAVDPDIAVVMAWHDALNGGDADGLAALTDDEVEVLGPQGSGHGVALVRAWAEGAGVRLVPGRVFRRGIAVVVEQRATWRSSETGQEGEPSTVATAFLVVDGKVRRAARYDDLAAALAAAGLDEVDEVRGAD